MLISHGGVYIGNIRNLARVYVNGKMVGNMLGIQSVTLGPNASVHGDITCQSLEVHPDSVLVGSLHATPFAALPLSAADDESPRGPSRRHLDPCPAEPSVQPPVAGVS